MEILQLNLLLKSDFLSHCYADRTAERAGLSSNFPLANLLSSTMRLFFLKRVLNPSIMHTGHACSRAVAGLFGANFVCTFSSFFNDLPHCLLETVCAQHDFPGFHAFLGGGFGNVIHELVLAFTQGLFTGGLHGILLGDCRADPWGHPTGLSVRVQGLQQLFKLLI